jgi:hypothetical protein
VQSWIITNTKLVQINLTRCCRIILSKENRWNSERNCFSTSSILLLWMPTFCIGKNAQRNADCVSL